MIRVLSVHPRCRFDLILRTSCFYLLLGIVGFRSAGYSQVIDNLRVTRVDTAAEGSRYFITYDLVAPHSNIPCFVRIKYTTIARQMYLKNVKGDVGNLVYPGNGKKIVWDYKEELVHSVGEGEAKFDVEVSPNVRAAGKVKKGKKLVVEIDSAFAKGKSYAFQLYRHEKEVERLNDTMILNYSFTLQMPQKINARGDYQLAIRDGEKTYFSNTFRIRRKVGLFWKALPFLAIPIYLKVNNTVEDNKPLPGAPEIN